MTKCTMYAMQMKEGCFIGKTVTYGHTGVKTIFFATVELEGALLLPIKEDWEVLKQELLPMFPGAEFTVIAVLYERTVVKPKEDFFITIASNQPTGPGYYRVIADSENEARLIANEQLDKHWSMLYTTLAQIHPLDRKFLGVLQ